MNVREDHIETARLDNTGLASSFSRVDEAPADIQATLVTFLDRMAALPGIQRVRQTARAALGIRRGQRLLDAGCGVGEEARELARLAGPDGEVTATDLSEGLLSVAAQRDEDNGIRYVVGDITALEFPDGTFDSVRSERVIQHVAEPDAAVAELVRVTAPGGRVCLIDTDWESMLVDGMPEELFGGLRRRQRELDLAKPSGRLLRRRLLRAGLEEVIAEPVSIPMTDRETAEALHPLFNPLVLRRVGRVPEELIKSWSDAFDAALARNEFLAVLTIWVVTGVKVT